MLGVKGGVFEAHFSLIVTGEGLPMDKISTLLNLQPTRVVRKGDVIKGLLAQAAVQDEWMFTVDADEPVGEDAAISNMLSYLEDKRAALEEVRAMGKVTLRLNVQSDYAHMTYCLVPATMQKMIDLNMPLEVSSLSWGEVF